MVEDLQLGLSFRSARSELKCLLPRGAFSGFPSSLTLCVCLSAC